MGLLWAGRAGGLRLMNPRRVAYAGGVRVGRIDLTAGAFPVLGLLPRGTPLLLPDLVRAFPDFFFPRRHDHLSNA